MYQYEQVDIFKRVIDANNEERARNVLRNGERKVPEQLSNNLLENISSNFMFPRPKKDVFARRNFFPKTGVQEKILYKKPPFTLRNVLKYHGPGATGQQVQVIQSGVLAPNQPSNRVVGAPTVQQYQPQQYVQPARSSQTAPQIQAQTSFTQGGAGTVSLKQLYDSGQTKDIQVVRRPDGRTSYVRTVTSASTAPVAAGGFSTASASVVSAIQRDTTQGRASYTNRSASAQPAGYASAHAGTVVRR